MASEAVFVRRDTPAGAQWSITPAGASKAFALVYVPVSLIAIVIAVAIGAAIGDFLGGVIGLAVALAFLWIRIWKAYVQSLGHRDPVSLVVDRDSLRAGSASYARRDIVELGIFPGYTGPATQPVASVSVVATANPMAMAAQAAGQIVGGVVLDGTRALRENLFSGQSGRSLTLQLRCKQGPQWHVLAGGLTPACAQALMTDVDVMEELQKPAT